MSKRNIVKDIEDDFLVFEDRGHNYYILLIIENIINYILFINRGHNYIIEDIISSILFIIEDIVISYF